MVDVFGQQDPRDQSRRSVAARGRPRRGRGQRQGSGSVQAVPELRPDDLALEQFRGRHIHLEGAFLADFFVKLGVLPHRLGDDFDGLLDRQFGKELLGDQAGLGPGALVRDHRPRRRLGRQQFLQFLQLQQQLRPVLFLALAGAEEALLKPGDLHPQLRVLLAHARHLRLQGEVLGVELFGGRHAEFWRVSISWILFVFPQAFSSRSRRFFIARTRLSDSRPSDRCPRAASSGPGA